MPKSKATLSPTKSLDEALRRFNPMHPLQTEDELESFYVAREKSPLEPLVTYLSGMKQPVKVLFMGHRGSGKSTELAKLASVMRDRFVVIHFHAAQALNINDVDPVDVVLGCALAVLNFAFLHEVDYEADLWREIDEWLRNEVLKETVNVKQSGKAGGLSLKALIGELSGRWVAESSTRRSLRPKLQSVISDLVQRVNKVIDGLQERLGMPALVLVEDLDKTLLTQARKVFYDEGRILHLLDCSVIYTFPISLCYSNDYRQIRQNFHRDFKLPNVRVNNPDGSAYDAGMDALRSLALRRADPSLFDSGALDRAIELSGGLVVDLVRILQGASLQAIVAKSPTITSQMVDAEAAEIRSNFRAALRLEHYIALRECAITHRIINETAVQEALHNLSLLEYRNDEDWCDVHPIAKPLLEQEEAGGKVEVQLV